MENYQTKNVNGVDVPLEPSEIAELEARDAAYALAKLAPPDQQTQRSARLIAYRDEADPIAFKMLRGEATLEQYTAKVAEIRGRFPYPPQAD